jgi:NAD/NADP transhydrogenase beta subunit
MFRTHLLRVFSYVAAVFWVAFVWGGLKVLSAPDTAKHSHLAGWAILALASAVMIATMNHWVKYLQLILGGGILGGLLVTIQGHTLNGALFPRSVAAALTVLLIGSSLISRTLAGRKLRILDRVALVAFLGALLGGMVQGTPISGIVGLAVGFGCLFIAWFYNRSSSGNEKRPGNGNGGTAASVRG